MKDELGRNFMTKFVGLRAKKQKTQKSVSQKENSYLEIANTVQKQLNLRTEYKVQKKNEIYIKSLKKS